MQRREFISFPVCAAALPRAARAQQAALPLVGYLSSGSPETLAHLVAQFRRGLSETGYAEGRNVVIEYRWSGGQYDRMAALAAALVRRQPSVLFARSLPGIRAAKTATATIPIVFGIGEDPVKEGIVASLSRPGGNVTGFTDFSNQLAGIARHRTRDGSIGAARQSNQSEC